MRSSKEWRRALEKARQVNNCTSFFFLISFPEIHLFFSDYWITITGMYIVVVKSFKSFCCCWKFTLFKYLSIYFFCCYSIPYIFHWILSFKKIMNWILKNFSALIVILFLMTLSNTFLVHKNSHVNYMCLNFIKAYTL